MMREECFKMGLGLIVSMALGAALGACTLPGSNAPTALAPGNLDSTQAYQTVVAQVNQAAATVTPAVPPSAAPSSGLASMTPTLPALPEATATLPPTQPLSEPPTDTPMPTVATSPTRTPAPTKILPTTDPLFALGEPTWSDTFDGSNTWYAYEDEQIRLQAKDGQLVMTAFKADYQVGWALAPEAASEKYYLEMTVAVGACRGRDRYGVFLSPTTDAEKGYLFDFSCDGNYSLWIWDGETATNLVYWTASPSIKAGANQVNRLGVKIVGNRIYMYANGILLGDVVSEQYEKKYYGVFIGAAETPDFTVKVDNLSYWALP
jgi:hypothetical protein